jgi:hypothetical protein
VLLALQVAKYQIKPTKPVLDLAQHLQWNAELLNHYYCRKKYAIHQVCNSKLVDILIFLAISVTNSSPFSFNNVIIYILSYSLMLA